MVLAKVASVAKQIVEMTSDAAKVFADFEKLIQKEREAASAARAVGDAGETAGKQLGDGMQAGGAKADKEMKTLLTQLRALGPAGKEQAKAVTEHLREAGTHGHQSMEKVLEQIRKMDPTAADAAQQAATAFEQAANSTEAEFEDIIAEMKALGPAGKASAEQFRKEMIAAGKISEKSIEDIIQKLQEIDPEAAKAARSISSNVAAESQKSKTAFGGFSSFAIREITAIGATYIGLRETIDAITAVYERQADLIREARDAQLELAAAQQQAAKNLAGVTPEARTSLLTESIPRIANAAQFSDTEAIADAIGALASSGATDPKAIESAVIAAAKLERLTPDNLAQSAVSASLIQQRSGLDDIEQALALLETTATQALITAPEQLARNLPKAVASGVATVPGQKSEEAATEAAAFFAQVTQFGADERGEKSATFTTDFVNRMRKFFVEIGDEQVKARSKVELIDRKIGKGSDTEIDRLNRDRLLEFLESSKGLQDPGTLFGRLNSLQGSEALARQFRGEGFGEKQFQVVLDGLLEDGSAIDKALDISRGVIGADRATFEREVEEVRAGTPQIALATAKSGSSAAVRSAQIRDTEGATLALIREIVSEQASRAGGFEFLYSSLDARGGLRGSTAFEEGASGLTRLGILEQSAPTAIRKAEINAARESLEQLLIDQAGSLDRSNIDRAVSRLRADQRIQAGVLDPEKLDRMIDALEDIAATNAITADNTSGGGGEVPSVTGALSGNTP